MEPKKKKASPYSLSKDSTEVKKLSKLHKALNKQTNQVWCAKVFDMELIEKNNLENHLEFNETVLMNLKNAEHVVYVNEIITKNQSTLFILEEWQQTLVNFVKTQSPLNQTKITQILRDVFEGLLQVYEAGYFHKNLRPQHIVCVDDVWKIQSFVLDSDPSPVKTEIAWSDQYISPQERAKPNNLESQKIDEQIVWQLGILGLYMIFGDSIQYRNLKKDDDIDWVKVKQDVESDVYQMLTACLKMNFDERIKIRGLATLNIFSDICDGKNLPFMSQSKFFLTPKQPKIVQSLTITELQPEEQKKIIKQLKTDFARFKYFGEVEYYIQQLPYKNSFDLTSVRYLSIKLGLKNLKKIQQDINSFNYNKSPEFSKVEKELQKTIGNMEKSSQSYFKFLNQSTEAKSSQLLNPFQQKDLKDENASYDTLKMVFMPVAGAIYTELRDFCLKKYNEPKQRAICYFSLAAYFVHFYNEQDFSKISSEFRADDGINFENWISRDKLDTVVEVTQQLVNKYFAIDMTR